MLLFTYNLNFSPLKLLTVKTTELFFHGVTASRNQTTVYWLRDPRFFLSSQSPPLPHYLLLASLCWFLYLLRLWTGELETLLENSLNPTLPAKTSSLQEPQVGWTSGPVSGWSDTSSRACSGSALCPKNHSPWALEAGARHTLCINNGVGMWFGAPYPTPGSHTCSWVCLVMATLTLGKGNPGQRWVVPKTVTIWPVKVVTVFLGLPTRVPGLSIRFITIWPHLPSIPGLGLRKSSIVDQLIPKHGVSGKLPDSLNFPQVSPGSVSPFLEDLSENCTTDVTSIAQLRDVGRAFLFWV
jgi:hypothetical protein